MTDQNRMTSLLSNLRKSVIIQEIRGADREDVLRQAASDTLLRFGHLPEDQLARVAFVRVRYELLRLARDRRRRQELLRAHADQTQSTPQAPDPEEAMMRYQLHEAMVSALDEEQQVIIRKHFFDGKPIQEIAAEMGMSRSTVSRRLAAAVSFIGKALGQSEEERPS